MRAAARALDASRSKSCSRGVLTGAKSCLFLLISIYLPTLSEAWLHSYPERQRTLADGDEINMKTEMGKREEEDVSLWMGFFESMDTRRKERGE